MGQSFRFLDIIGKQILSHYLYIQVSYNIVYQKKRFKKTTRDLN